MLVSFVVFTEVYQ